MGRRLCDVIGVADPSKLPDCDSIKIAGILELLRTQGVWSLSLRLAWIQMCQVRHIKDGTAKLPPASALAHAAGVADGVFAEHAKAHDASPWSADDTQALIVALADALSETDLGKATVDVARADENASVLLGGVMLLVRNAVQNFFTADLFSAMTVFLAHAVGSFGLSASSALDPSVVVIASRGQPMSLSVAPESGAVLWGSEVVAQTNAPLPAPRSGPPGDAEAPAPASHLAYRHDLNERDGEVIELDTAQGGRAAAWFMRHDRAARFQPFPEDMPTLFMRAGRLHAATHDVEGHANAARPGPGELGDDEAVGVDAEVAPGYAVSNLGQIRRLCKPSEFLAPESLIALRDNAFFESSSAPSPSPSGDLVAQDLRDVPVVLNRIRTAWGDASSPNSKSARKFFAAIREAVLRKLRPDTDASERVSVDVLVIGVEVSLWIGEQFASDLQTLFPCLRVIPCSANKIIGVLSNAKGSFAMTGFSFCSVNLDLKRTIVVSLSHSGQTFPTMHATHALAGLLPPERMFVVVGSVDSKMAQAVGQHVYRGCEWNGSVFDTFAGWRPAEACTVSALAMHHTLTELLLFVAERVHRDKRDGGGGDVPTTERAALARQRTAPASKFRLLRNASTGRIANAEGELDHVVVAESITLSAENAAGLRQCSDMSVLFSLPAIVGSADNKLTHARLVALGRHWGGHVLESPLAWMLSAAYIAITVVVLQLPAAQFTLWAASRVACEAMGPPDSSLTERLCGPDVVAVPDVLHAGDRGPSGPAWWDVLVYALKLADAVIYVFLPLWVALLLRALQRRAPFARLGKRTVVVADVPYVHQTLESYASKLFALAYSATGIDVHGANPIDHLVHRFTHRVARGVLVLAGRPDGRLYTQTRAESWILLALRQAKCIVHPFVPKWLRPNMERWVHPDGLAGPGNLGFGPEVITVGHNPFEDPVALDGHVALPKHRPSFITEVLADSSWDAPEDGLGTTTDAPAPTQAKSSSEVAHPADHLMRIKEIDRKAAGAALSNRRKNAIGAHALAGLREDEAGALAASYAMVASLASRNGREGRGIASIQRSASRGRDVAPEASLVSPLTVMHAMDAAATLGNMTAISSIASAMDAMVAPPGASQDGTPIAPLRRDSFGDNTGSAGGSSLRSYKRLRRTDGSFLGLGSGILSPVADESEHGIPERQAADVPAAAPNLLELFTEAGAAEQWWENRIASMERMLAHFVLLHAMAERSAGWPLPFEVWRTQSQLRVATTAAPISAADVVAAWQ